MSMHKWWAIRGEILKKNPPTICSCIKKNKILRNKFNQGDEKSIHYYKKWIKENEKNTNMWKDVPCSWTEYMQSNRSH